jgi:hypothetical protein
MLKISKMIKMPKFFHDILGEESHVISLFLIAGVTAVIMGWLALTESDVFIQNGRLKGGIGFLFLMDIIAGTVANFTKGTNDYYAARPANRWVFIAVHIQPILIAWLLGFQLQGAVLIWGFTILSVSLVNVLKGTLHQRVVSGALMSLGIFLSLVLYKDSSMVMLLMSIFFVIKVIYSFGVDHEQGGQV